MCSLLILGACESAEIKEVENGKAEFLKDVQLVRDDIKLTSPWIVEDLEKIGIEDLNYHENNEFKDEVYEKNRMIDNHSMLLDGAFGNKGSNINCVIIHAYNLTGNECQLHEMTLQQIILNEGSEKISLNGDIYIGANREDIIKKYGKPENKGKTVSYYRLYNADSSSYNGQGKSVDLELHLNFDKDGKVEYIRFAIHDQVDR